MFSKLKEKLKDALSIFSKKTEEQAEVTTTTEDIVTSEVATSTEVITTPELQAKITEVITTPELIPEEEKPISIKQAPKSQPTTISPITETKARVPIIPKKIETPKPTETQKLPTSPTIKTDSTREIEQETTIPQEYSSKKEATKSEEKTEINKPPTQTKKSEPEKPQQLETKGFFSKVKEAITTKTINEEKFEELFWDLEITLLENNVSVEVIDKIKSDLKGELVNKPLPRDVASKIEETLRKTLKDILTYNYTPILTQIKQSQKKPFIIAFFGINGAGKTTSIAKLTHYLQKNNLTVVLAACDTFRAAAIQQLEEHAVKLHTKIIKHDYGSDAAAVAYDAIKYAQKNNNDVVLIDTAGRLHSNTNLMAELEKIIRTTKPDLKIFVGESITGNDCIEQAREFNNLVQMDGAILTKADIDEKGGAPISISYIIKKPIFFLGTGQTYDDFIEFNKEKILESLGL